MLRRRVSSWRRDDRLLKLLRLSVSLATLLVWAGAAHAETVAILRPSSPSSGVTQALTLVRGELLSVGLEVILADRASVRAAEGTDSVAWLEPFAAGGVSAVVEAIGGDTLEAVDVWVMKTHPERFEVTRVPVDPKTSAQPEVLALRVVEALRAGLIQTDWAARKRRNETAAEVAPAPVASVNLQAAANATEHVDFEVGAAGVMSLDGLGLAFLPTVRAGWAVSPSLLLHLSAAGLGTRSTVSTAAGSALVAQQYAVAGGRYRVRPDRRVWPFLGLAVGVLHTSIEGQSGWGTGGHTAERWSGLLDASLGAGLRLYGRYYMTLAAHAQIAAPYVAIYLVDTAGATSGRPNLLLSLTIGAWL